MRPGIIPDNEIPAADPAAVIKQYERWIRKIVKRYAGLLSDTGAVDTEDMIQAGSMAILEAQKTFDPEAGASFISWSYKPVRNAILELFGYDNPGRNRPEAPLISLDETIDEGGEVTRLDTIQDPNCISPEEKAVQDSAREEIREEVLAAIDRMKNDKYKTVVKKLWLEGQDKKTLADEMGLSIENIGLCDRNGRGKLSLDYRLKKLYYPLFNVGIKRYQSTLTSAVEAAVLWREQQFDGGTGSFLIAGLSKNTDDP